MRRLFQFTFVLTLLAPRLAISDDREECLAASSAGQDDRNTNKLIEARAQLLTCARESCPAVVRRDCTEWLAEVDDALPTVVISVRDEKGTDIVAVRVVVDSAPFLDRLEGTAVPMNPGIHKIQIETDGMNPFEQEIVIHAAEKNRSLVFTVHQRTEQVKLDPAPTPVAPTSTNPISRAPTAIVEDDGGPSMVTPRRKLAIGLAASGGAALIAGAILGASAQGKHDDAHALCPDPQTPCADAATATALSDSAHSRAIGADAVFVVGASALIVGGVLWFTGGPARTHGIAIVPATRGVAVFGRF